MFNLPQIPINGERILLVNIFMIFISLSSQLLSQDDCVKKTMKLSESMYSGSRKINVCVMLKKLHQKLMTDCIPADASNTLVECKKQRIVGSLSTQGTND